MREKALPFTNFYEQPLKSLPDPETALPPSESPAKRLPRHRSTAGRNRRIIKHELELLRHDVRMLQERLTRVKKGASLDTLGAAEAPYEMLQSASGTKSIWMKLAIHQASLRQSSQSTNRRLKLSLAKQLNIAKCLEDALLRKSDEKQTLHTIDLYNVPGYLPLQQPSDNDELVFGSLLIHLQQLYASKDSHVKQSGLEADLVTMHTKSKHDPTHGMMLQTASSMAVPFSVQQTNAVIWEGLTNGYKRILSANINAHHRIVTEDRIRKNYMSNFQHQQTTYGLHNRSIIRKYTEAERVVYAWTTVTILGSMGLRFFAQGMMIIEPSKTVPLRATVFKNLYRVHGERIGTTKSTACDQIDRLIEAIQKMLSGTMIATFRWLEGNLLDAIMSGEQASLKHEISIEKWPTACWPC